jgi:hypothetical protein
VRDETKHKEQRAKDKQLRPKTKDQKPPFHLPNTQIPLTIPHMSEPEIARRCLSCGASVRQQAAFCPQCGQVLSNAKAQEQPDYFAQRLNEDLKPADAMAQTVAEQLPDSLSSDGDSRQTIAIQRPPTVVDDEPPLAPAQPDPEAAIEDHQMGRVERLRKVSSVVIDQAAYDPSLRFLLVAAVLFILFLILIILSKVIG